MKQKETQQETMSKEKRVVFFEGKSWYHRTKELQDDLTTKYGKKGGFETPEEAEKSYWEYEKRYQKKQRDLQIAKMQKTDVMLGDYLEYWFENIFSPRIETTTRMVGAYTLCYYEKLCEETDNFNLSIKLVERTKSTKFLTRVVEAYARRQYKGNLLDILLWPKSDDMVVKTEPTAEEMKTMAELYNISQMFNYSKIFDLPNIYIDNTKLDGFLGRYYASPNNRRHLYNLQKCH